MFTGSLGAALTATEAGKKTFERMGCKPTGYKEIFVETSDSDGRPGREIRMMYEYPGVDGGGKERQGQQSWSAKRGPELEVDVVAVSETSEMVVAYPSELKI